jgi:hypothetical protein
MSGSGTKQSFSDATIATSKIEFDVHSAGDQPSSPTDRTHPVSALDLEGVLSATLPAEQGNPNEEVEPPPVPPPGYGATGKLKVKRCDAVMAYGIFPRDGAVRMKLNAMTSHFMFDNIILLVILYNTILMIATDFARFDPKTGDIVAAGSDINGIVIASDLPLLIIFCCEFVMKSVALGFYSGKGAYIKDNWNKLDFAVVISGLLENIPGFPNLTMLRCFRVLRPLRSISRLPNLKLQVNLIIRSVTELGNVICLLIAFIFFLALVGLQLWGVSGTLHGRCRLTPFPVKYANKQMTFPVDGIALAALYNQNLDPSDPLAVVRCSSLPAEYEVSAASVPFHWNEKHSDNWTPQDCAWPMDPANTGCALEQYGGFTCPSDQWCGSNYDSYGHRRFVDKKIMHADEYAEKYNWAWTAFDHIGTAFLAIFQSVTLEGWSDIMYIIQDGYQPDFGALFFIFTTLTGSFFMLNLALAIVFNVMVAIHEEEAEADVQALLTKFFLEMDTSKDGVVCLKEMTETKFYKRLAISDSQMTQLFDAIDVNKNGTLEYIEFYNFSVEAFDHDIISLAKSLKVQSGQTSAEVVTVKPWMLVHVAKLRPIAESANFDLFIVAMIFANIIVLALDRYPMAMSETAELEVLH